MMKIMMNLKIINIINILNPSMLKTAVNTNFLEMGHNIKFGLQSLASALRNGRQPTSNICICVS